MRLFGRRQCGDAGIRSFGAPILHRLLTLFLFGTSAAATVASSSIPLELREEAGIRRVQEHVTSGVPFPMAALTNIAQVRLLNEQGKEIPLQVRISATWRDGSVKWLLLDFALDAEAQATRRLALEYGEGVARAVAPVRMQLQESAGNVEVFTGRLRFTVPMNTAAVMQNIRLHSTAPDTTKPDVQVAEKLQAFLFLAGAADGLEPLPPAEVKVEESGPQRAVLRISGGFADVKAPAKRPALHYLCRLQAFAGSPAVQVQYTLINLAPTNSITPIRSYGLRIAAPTAPHDGLHPAAPRVLLGGDRTVHRVALTGASATVDLLQPSEGEYHVRSAADEMGIRAPGWLAWKNERAGMLIAVRDFWQQFPKNLHADRSGVAVELFPAAAAEPFDCDQGLAKTHELLLDFDAAQITPETATTRAAAFEHPLFAVAPSTWYCDSKVFGDLAPFDFDLFPDYETLVEAGGDKFIQSMATGIRNWGDFYYGGPYKGKNSFMDLEYDVTHNFLLQFARTGQRKYFDAARRMARHQADIDVNHFTGWQWKHSPRHTEIQAEFGHTFTRGLLEHYFLTGDRRTLEAAVELGGYFAREFQKPGGLGNERQIGWGLISLLPVYEATWDSTYIDAVNSALNRLIAGLDARGRFSIRWDNRISFMSGIAATGLIYVHRATGDERVADAALRVIGRTKGFYPEYMGRTLEALAWAFQRTQDPEYLDLLKLTYETSQGRAIAWRTMDLGAATIFTVHALPWLEQCGLALRPADPLHLAPEQFASENGLFAHHLPNAQGEFWFQHAGNEPLRLTVIRKGAWKGPGEAVLLDPAGAIVAQASFPAEPVVLQRRSLLAARSRPGTYVLKLQSPPVLSDHGSWITWDVVTAQPTPTLVTTPHFAGLQFITPRLYTVPEPNAQTIDLTLVGEGEGFKKAVLADPAGRPVAVLAQFVDLGDKGRHEYQISARVPPGQHEGLWSLTLQDVALAQAKGLPPYFASTPQSFFRPAK